MNEHQNSLIVLIIEVSNFFPQIVILFLMRTYIISGLKNEMKIKCKGFECLFSIIVWYNPGKGKTVFFDFTLSYEIC